MSHVLKLILSAAVITMINKAGIASGFLIWYYSGTPNQLMVQVPLALTVSIGGTLFWLLRCERWHRLALERDAIYVFLLILPVGAFLFVPIHYLWTGYLTSFGNIIGGWMFAFLANVPAFALAASLWRRRESPGPRQA
jgi:hypothetical protein